MKYIVPNSYILLTRFILLLYQLHQRSIFKIHLINIGVKFRIISINIFIIITRHSPIHLTFHIHHFELHHILGQCSRLVTENVLDLSQLFIQRRTLYFCVHVIFFRSEMVVLSDHVSLDIFHCFQTD